MAAYDAPNQRRDTVTHRVRRQSISRRLSRSVAHSRGAESNATASIVLVKAFVQANTLKGWRYLDLAGSVMNHYTDTFVDMNVGLQGLGMRNPAAVMDEARVTPHEIWVGFTRPATLGFVTDKSWNFIATVAEMLGIQTFSRLGLRLQYVLGDPADARSIARAAGLIFGGLWTGLGDPESFGAMMQVRAGQDLSAAIRIDPVKLAEGAKEDAALPKDGFNFDADVFRTGTLQVISLRPFLRAAADWCSSTIPPLAHRFAQEAAQ